MTQAEMVCDVCEMLSGQPERASDECMVYLLTARMLRLFLDAGATPAEAERSLDVLQGVVPIISSQPTPPDA